MSFFSFFSREEETFDRQAPSESSEWPDGSVGFLPIKTYPVTFLRDYGTLLSLPPSLFQVPVKRHRRVASRVRSCRALIVPPIAYFYALIV